MSSLDHPSIGRCWRSPPAPTGPTGHPKAVFPTTFADLVALTGGMAAHVAAGEENGEL